MTSSETDFMVAISIVLKKQCRSLEEALKLFVIGCMPSKELQE